MFEGTLSKDVCYRGVLFTMLCLSLSNLLISLTSGFYCCSEPLTLPISS